MKFSYCIRAWLIVRLMLITVALPPPDAAGAADTQVNEAERQFSFAESLFAEGDYYRAVSEYKRFAFLFPENKLVENCAYRIGESYYKAKGGRRPCKPSLLSS